MNMVLFTIAMAPPAGADGAPQQSPIFMFGWIAIMIAVFYFLMIRPQQKRAKERQKLLDAVKSGDRVVFSGGILGVVTNVKDKTLMIKVADNVKLEVSRAAVTQVLDKGETPEQEDK
jgi:preprotein translocase subunit YajC